ncbi:MAG: tetratricopeptide repeat protein [Chloroflexi bacterium]|nr:tetratricopeptide repeat protein [Chloroflexota bacterium]
MMQNRSAAAATWHYLATVDVNEGRLRDAQSKFRMALSIQQELGDIEGEANTFANLGALAAELGRGEWALQLYVISVLLMREVDHPNLPQVERAANQLAQDLEYDDREFSHLINEVINAYHMDRGWSIIEEAFADAFWSAWE